MRARISAWSAKPRASSTNSSRPGTRGSARGMFEAPKFQVDVTKTPVPRFDLLKFEQYLYIGVQFSRGCPFTCEFCDIIELYGRSPRTKTHAQMLDELEALYQLGYRGHVDFVDDNLIGNKKAIKAFLPALEKWIEQHDYPFEFSTEASLNLADDAELLADAQAVELFRDLCRHRKPRRRRRSRRCARSRIRAAASPTACTRSIGPACSSPRVSLSASTPRRARSPSR